MRALVCFGSFALLLGTLNCTALGEDTVSYPEQKPAFALDLPKGWKAKHEDGAVRIEAEANAVFLLQRTETVKDEARAKSGLPEVAEYEGRQFNMQGMKISTHVRDVRMGDFHGFMTDASGTDAHGYVTFWQVFIFAVKDEYFVVTSLWTSDDGDKTAADRAAVFTSLKPVL